MPFYDIGNTLVSSTTNLSPNIKKGLINRLLFKGSNLSQFDGQTPTVSNQDTPQSKLHYEYSINGNPDLLGYPPPSLLDLNDPIGADPNYKPIYTPTNSYKSKIQSLNQ